MYTYPTGSCLLFADGKIVLFVPGQNGESHRTRTVCERPYDSVWTVNPEHGEHQKIFCLDTGMDICKYEGKPTPQDRTFLYIPVDGEAWIVDQDASAILLKEWDATKGYNPNRHCVFI
jgi:hypothetical protein